VNADLAQVHHLLNTDLQFFARNAPLLVKDKSGALVKWEMNLAQRYAHDKIEEQRRKTGGWVRALIVKGRQQGMSTYVEGRFYHRVTRVPGTSAMILSHEGAATDHLFSMVKRYHDNVSAPVQPTVDKSNTRQLIFGGLGSDFRALTANNPEAGRGGTAQVIHGSEAAYWEYAYQIQDGALQTIALIPGTEIILESTANGPVGLFYEKVQQALKGEGDYVLIFVPWFWQNEYERDYDATTFQLTAEEEAYVKAYLSKPFPYHVDPPSRDQVFRKMAWRRATIVDLSNEGGGNPEIGRAKFRTIYPANPVEAFQSTGSGLFRPDAITAARASTLVDDGAARVAGVDPAGDSDNADRTVISIRQGRRIEKRVKFSRMRPMELAGILARLIDSEALDMVFIDRGYGEGTIDRLVEMGYGSKVIGVAFNERPMNPDLYSNKRTEMYMEYAKWLNAGDVRIPDDDEGHAALACIPPSQQTSSGLHMLKSKAEIKRALGGDRLLDIADADALTFAYPVRSGGNNVTRFKKVTTATKGGGLTSMARFRKEKG
jgi:hypothetical protein